MIECQSFVVLIVRGQEVFAHALTFPAPPFVLQEACRIENLESYLHQADIVFRRCVSTSIKDYKGKNNYCV